MSLLPCLVDSILTDGTLIKALPYCKKNCTSSKCQKFYSSLITSAPGIYMCPNGLTSIVSTHNEGQLLIYSGLRAKNFYDKKKSKITQSKENIYNPLLEPEHLLALAEEDTKFNEKMNSIVKKEEDFKDVLHEARKFNAQIKNICDVIWDEQTNAPFLAQENTDLYEKILNIHVCSYLAYNRFSYYDIITNPELSCGSPYEATIFKKFDKLRKLLKNYERKKVWISLENQSTFNYPVYHFFETLLFIILENAIKYSPNNNPVNVYFYETGDQMDVLIKSLGPYCNKEELAHIAEKGYRGTNAKLFDTTGQGIGLPFAKKIADMHNIEITFASTYTKTIKKIPFGEFCVTLHFDKTI